MQTIRMKLADMHKPEKNVRMHTENQLVEYERSVRMFGQTRPIIVDEDGLILVGNGLFDTLSRMGEEDADVYVMKGLSQSEKKKLMIADNKIFNLGVENLTVLNEFIEDLKDDLDIPGFDEDILRDMVADAEAVTETINSYGLLDEQEIQDVKETNARREESRRGSSEPATGAVSGQNTNQDLQAVIPSKDAEKGRYVICPKCGETIWL